MEEWSVWLWMVLRKVRAYHKELRLKRLECTLIRLKMAKESWKQPIINKKMETLMMKSSDIHYSQWKQQTVLPYCEQQCSVLFCISPDIWFTFFQEFRWQKCSQIYRRGKISRNWGTATLAISVCWDHSIPNKEQNGWSNHRFITINPEVVGRSFDPSLLCGK